MSNIQKFFTWILPKKWAEDMEAHSRSWMMRCDNCQFEQSIWDLGGIKWKAYGNSISLRRCPNCGKIAKHTLYRKLATPK